MDNTTAKVKIKVSKPGRSAHSTETGQSSSSAVNNTSSSYNNNKNSSNSNNAGQDSGNEHNGAVTDYTRVPMGILCSSSHAKKRLYKAPGSSSSKKNRTNNNDNDRLNSFNTQSIAEPEKLGPRVEVINGKIVLMESSLVVGQETVNVDGEFEEIEEGANTASRYSSFTNNRRAGRWNDEDTKKFFEVLRQCGTDFSTMEAFFPNRTRKELKSMFFRQEKRHPELVKSAMKFALPLDMAPFESLTTSRDNISKDDPPDIEGSIVTAD